MNKRIPSTVALLMALVFTLSSCHRSTTAVPTAEDIRIGRQAISVSEVSLLARSGLHREALDSVKQRHVPEQLSAEEELNLRGFAKAELLAALKDPQNILTPAQKDAYDEAKGKQAVQANQAANTQALQANNQRQLSSAQTEQAYAASVAEQQENERRRQLNQQSIYTAERAKAEREAREQEQLRSVDEKWRTIDAQNSYHRPYNTPYPSRRIRPDNRDNRPDSNNPPRP
jgi:hypothetical protein